MPPDAGMDAEAEPEVTVGRAVRDEFKGTIERFLVAIAGGKADEQAVAYLDRLAADLVIHRRRPKEMLDRRDPAHHFLSGIRDEVGIALQTRQCIGILDQREQAAR